MNIAAFSIKRPIFIMSIVILMLFTGLISLGRLGVDLFPDITFPLVTVRTIYPGAAPAEIENLVTKPIEDELVGLSGLKRISSRSLEGVSFIFVEFTLGTDIKFAVQEVRNKVSLARPNLPETVEEPIIDRFDPLAVPVVRLAVMGDLPPAKLYDVTKEEIKTAIEQVADVGNVTIIGGSRREIQVELDRDRMALYQISALSIANKIKSSGTNIPSGKYEKRETETVFRTIGQFEKLSQIENIPISFAGDFGGGVALKTIANVRDGVEDETTRGYLYAPVGSPPKNSSVKRELKPAILLDVRKQSGTNTVAVADGVKKRLAVINEHLKGREGNPRVHMVYDGSHWIRINIDDVFETIIIAIILAVFVVYLFLGNVRSTIITGLALPNSMLGAFILMYAMGFSINLLTLMALSLSVGLLVDDAIVVRENIFRHLEDGMHPVDAAEAGTMQVALAVVAVTATIIAVFLPMGFMQSMVGQFFKQFGLTVVFALLISLFDAMTMAPLLSAYFAGKQHGRMNWVVRKFDEFHTWLEHTYGRLIELCLDRPKTVIAIMSIVFLASMVSVKFIKKTFQPQSEQGEFMITMELTPGISLDGTERFAMKVFEKVKNLPEVDRISIVVGGDQGEPYKSTLGVNLLPVSKRKRGSIEVQRVVREMFATDEFKGAKIMVQHYSTTGGSNYPFTMNIRGDNLEELETYATTLIDIMNRKVKDLIEIKSSLEGGKPEFQVVLDPRMMDLVGVTSGMAGQELRYHVAGEKVGKLHQSGLEYNIRLRLKPEQRDLEKFYYQTKVPNSGQQQKLIPVSAISEPVKKLGPSFIMRENRQRVVQINANTAPDGGVGDAIDAVKGIFKKELPLKAGMTYGFIGAAEAFGEMQTDMLMVFVLALVFIYLVLASLYESFITPVTILAAIPPAVSGAFLALLVTREMLSMMAWIGLIMLIGLVTKNSILLVDFIVTGEREGKSRRDAIREAGMVRLRPILMTTFAMIAGTMPVALGWGEAAGMRTSMGIVIVGGLLVSTLITLFVVPSMYGYVDSAREWIESKFRPRYEMQDHLAHVGGQQATETTEEIVAHSETTEVEMTISVPRQAPSRSKAKTGGRKKR